MLIISRQQKEILIATKLDAMNAKESLWKIWKKILEKQLGNYKEVRL